MANETYVTVIGRLTKDPEYRVTPSGAAVANFSIAVNARKFDRNTNEWKDEPTKFWDADAWNQGKMQFADNITESLKKGDNVVAYGEIRTREYERDGQTHRRDTLSLVSLGKDLRWHTVAQAPASGGFGNGGGGFGNAPQSSTPQGGGWNAPAADPWKTGGDANDEPPF